MTTTRHDYAYPFRIDAGSGQAARTGYAEHVEEMLRQLLLTSPGERTRRPDFGCGIRRLLFAPQSDALIATVRLQVQQAVERWLAGHIRLSDVTVTAGGPDEGALQVTVSYVLIDTLVSRTLSLRVV